MLTFRSQKGSGSRLQEIHQLVTDPVIKLGPNQLSMGKPLHYRTHQIWDHCMVSQGFSRTSAFSAHLEHHVVGEGVFGAVDDILCLWLSEGHRLRRGLEEGPQPLEFWNCCQLLWKTQATHTFTQLLNSQNNLLVMVSNKCSCPILKVFHPTEMGGDVHTTISYFLNILTYFLISLALLSCTTHHEYSPPLGPTKDLRSNELTRRPQCSRQNPFGDRPPTPPIPSTLEAHQRFLKEDESRKVLRVLDECCYSYGIWSYTFVS